jgi:hypothetical protein
LFGLLNIKVLILVALLASPPVAAWMMRHDSKPTEVIAQQQLALKSSQPPATEPMRVAVEVVAKGTAPQWVYVEVQNQAVPEPGCLALLAASSFLLLRRRREAGK